MGRLYRWDLRAEQRVVGGGDGERRRPLLARRHVAHWTIGTIPDSRRPIETGSPTRYANVANPATPSATTCTSASPPPTPTSRGAVCVVTGAAVATARPSRPWPSGSPTTWATRSCSSRTRASPPAKSAYAASNVAVHAFSESLRAELRGNGVGVTQVVPGPLATGIVRAGRAVDPAQQDAEVRFVEHRAVPLEPLALGSSDVDAGTAPPRRSGRRRSRATRWPQDVDVVPMGVHRPRTPPQALLASELLSRHP
jgi:NAD(P)-dependent dehydrogenase (short-subunit alcohol dehydrogenase family)